MLHSIYRYPDGYMNNEERLLKGLESPDMLGADDFIDVFNNIADFEKEIGIDGEVNSSNIQSIGTEQEQTDTLNYHMQVNDNSKSLDSLFCETGSSSAIPSTSRSNFVSSGSNTYIRHLHETTLTAPFTAANETDFISSGEPRTMSLEHSNGGIENRISKLAIARMEQVLEISCSSSRAYELAVQHQRRQQKRQGLINQRRQQFQRQKRMDEEYITQHLFRIEEQERTDENQRRQRATEQAWKRQKDGASLLGLALRSALSGAVSAATAIGMPQLDRSNSNNSQSTAALQHQTLKRQQRQQQNVHDPMPEGNTDDLDPNDPDPWDEEMQHYLLMGQIKRLEGLQAIRDAEMTGKEYTATLYSPTGIQRHEFDSLLSRNGAGLSMIGAAMDAVSSNARIRPSGNQGSSLVLQDQYKAHTYAQCLDIQSLSKRQRISRTFGTTESNDYLATCANNEPGKSNYMDFSVPNPSLTCDKTSKLMISNLCVDVTESTLESLAPKFLKSLYLNRRNNTAILYFLSIESAVMFRRMHDRSLLGGKHITVDFIKN